MARGHSPGVTRLARGVRRTAALLAALAAVAASPARALVPVPPLTGPVVDRAGLLDGGDAARLEALARAARAQQGGQGVQLQYLTVPALEGESIEDFSIRVAEAWKIGSKGADNGVLVTVAREERAVRIEVGGGLEGALTDAQAGRIIRGTIVPAFRAGSFGDGLYQAGVQILGALGALPEGAAPPPSPPGVHLSSLAVIAFVLLFLVLRMFSGFGFRRRRSVFGLPWMLGGGSRWGGRGGWGGGGGFGGGFGGGGGWSGGGGGFSGGGASGRW